MAGLSFISDPIRRIAPKFAISDLALSKSCKKDAVYLLLISTQIDSIQSVQPVKQQIMLMPCAPKSTSKPHCLMLPAIRTLESPCLLAIRVDLRSLINLAKYMFRRRN
jgi:hypothetical protein